MAGPLSMVFVGNRCAKKGHYPIPCELVNRAFIFVDFIHQDLETPIHDLVDFLGV
jgi:hypothetical protein